MSLRVISFWALVTIAMLDNLGVAATHLQFRGDFRDTGPGEVSTFMLDLYIREGVSHATTISDLERAPTLTSGSYTAEYPIRAHVGITISPLNELEEAGAYYLLGDPGDDSTLSLIATPALNGWDQYLQTGDGQLYFLLPETVDGLLGTDLSHWSLIPVPESRGYVFWFLLVVALQSRRLAIQCAANHSRGRSFFPRPAANGISEPLRNPNATKRIWSAVTCHRSSFPRPGSQRHLRTTTSFQRCKSKASTSRSTPKNLTLATRKPSNPIASIY